MKEYVTIKYEYVHQTEDAVLIFTADGKVWIPKSVIEYGHECDFSDDHELDFEMAIEEWFAIKEELV